MNSAPYWIALAHIPNWSFKKINSIIVKFHHERKIPIEEFFLLSENVLKSVYGFSEDDFLSFLKAKTELANHAFLAETLINQGYEILPIIDPEFPKTLKEKLKVANCPPLLYVKGNKQLLNLEAISIFSSTKLNEHSENFIGSLCKKNELIISSVGKGAEILSLEKALENQKSSIIVLNQGILTFDSGFKKYYKDMVNGKVLVLSSLPPKQSKTAESEDLKHMIRFGLSSEVYIAELSSKDPFLKIVLELLNKGAKMKVRKVLKGEKNANSLLINSGGVPIDGNGMDFS